jgi:hypothetical protein
MDAPFQLVGCVLASRPAPELIDAFVAQVRRERAAVLVKSAQGATFVRFGARDIVLVTMACQALRGPGAAVLRFGFALGSKDGAASGVANAGANGPANGAAHGAAPGAAHGAGASVGGVAGAGAPSHASTNLMSPATPAPQHATHEYEDGLHISTRSVAQANELAAGAGDGEVLVSPQLAVLLLEAGLALRSRRVALAGGRHVAACAVDVGGAAQAVLSAPAKTAAAAPASDALLLQKADAVGTVLRTLMAQADEMARRQGELEARQDAVLGKMTLVDTGSPSARHLGELEAELDAQLVRVEARLAFIERLEQRLGDMQGVIGDVERRLGEQLPRLAEIENFSVVSDTLLTRLVDAQERLDGVAAVQERLLPLVAQVESLAETASGAERMLATFEDRFAALDDGAHTVQRQLRQLGDSEAMVQTVRAQIDDMRAISAAGRADFEHVSAQRAELAELRAKLEGLLGSVGETDEKIAYIEARRKVVEEVQSRASTITHMLGDIQVNMEMLGEQRAVLDHVGEKVSRLDFMVQEAQNTLRALQREREVAERIEQGIKSLRARSAAIQSG